LYRGITLLVTGRNIKKSYLIGTLLVVASSDFNGVAGISDANKIDAFNNPALVNIEAGNNAPR
jgi:hypothetical protein